MTDYATSTVIAGCEHVTAPRRTWQEAGLTLTDPPPDLATLNEGTGVYASTIYDNVYHFNTSWGFRFRVQGRLIQRQGYTSEEDAARAHDAYVIAHDLDRKLIFGESEDVA